MGVPLSYCDLGTTEQWNANPRSISMASPPATASAIAVSVVRCVFAASLLVNRTSMTSHATLKSGAPGGSTMWSCPGTTVGSVPYTSGMLLVATPATSPLWSGQFPGTPSQLSVPTVDPGGYSTRNNGETACGLVCVGNA